MNIMELSSAEKRREENIRKNREFQIQIGFTSLVVQNRVASQEKIIRQDYVKRKIVETSARRSRRIEKQVEEERNRKEKKEIGKEFRCKYCYKIYRSTRTYPNAGALKLHQRNPKCAIYHVESTNIDTGNTSYIQVYFNLSVYHRLSI